MQAVTITQITPPELEALIENSIIKVLSNQKNEQVSLHDPEPLIYGIKGLAKFLQVSTVTAQKIKNSGKIPFSQVERTIVLNKVDVLEALKKKAGKRHG